MPKPVQKWTTPTRQNRHFPRQQIDAETSCFRLCLMGRPLEMQRDNMATTRVAIYLRVSTDHQTVENRFRELAAAAAARG